MVIFPCVCNSLRRASEKPLRTAETGMGFLEGDGAGEVEFNSGKIRSSLEGCQKHSVAGFTCGRRECQSVPNADGVFAVTAARNFESEQERADVENLMLRDVTTLDNPKPGKIYFSSSA
jgi:hypothetical protein